MRPLNPLPTSGRFCETRECAQQQRAAKESMRSDKAQTLSKVASNAERRVYHSSRQQAQGEERKAGLLRSPVHSLVYLGVANDGLHVLSGLGERNGLYEFID